MTKKKKQETFFQKYETPINNVLAIAILCCFLLLVYVLMNR